MKKLSDLQKIKEWCKKHNCEKCPGYWDAEILKGIIIAYDKEHTGRKR